METGTKHIIQCHCILPQYKMMKDPVFHKFIVFSLIDSNDDIIPKFSQCNNCGVIHKVIDICKSEIVHGFEDESAILNIADIKTSLSKDIVSILETYNCDIATWEHVLDVIEEERWGENIILNRNIIDSQQNVKVLNIFEGDSAKTVLPEEFLSNTGYNTLTLEEE